MTDFDPALLEKVAQAIDSADDRWQHGIGGSRDMWERYVARAALAAMADDIRAEAWDWGYRAGFSIAMRRMSDEPKAPTPSNPYLGESDD